MRRRIIGALAVLGILAAVAPTQLALASDDGSDDADELKGVVESLPDGGLIGDWVVSGVTVHVTEATEIEEEHGAIALGATVEAHGVAEADGTFTASKIETTEDSDDDRYGEMKLWGYVDSLPDGGLIGDWVVSGVTVHVTEATEIEEEHGAIALGATVKVEGLAEADGSITAHEVETEDPSEVAEHATILLGVAKAYPRGDHVGTWNVSRHDVRVRESTRIVHERRLSKGSRVRVFGTLRANGTIRATEVVVRSA